MRVPHFLLYIVCLFSNRTTRAVWALREEVAVALLQTGAAPQAWALVQAADRSFPETTRASRLMVRPGKCWRSSSTHILRWEDTPHGARP